MGFSAGDLVLIVESPVICAGCKETVNKLLLLVMALSQSRHSPRIQLSRKELWAISEKVRRDYTPKYSSKTQGKSSHFRLSAEEMRAIGEEIRRDFAVRPAPRLSEARIVLLPVDPYRLHAYWHLDEAKTKGKPTQPLVLRLYPSGARQTAAPGQPDYIDIAIAAEAGQYEVRVPEYMTSDYYCAAIGWYPDAQHFAALARSEQTYLPRNAVRMQERPSRRSSVNHHLHHNASGRGRRA